MIRFGDARRASGFPIPPRDRARLLAMVASLGLVLVAMGQAKNPEQWRWLWAGDQRQAPSDTPSKSPAAAVDPIPRPAADPLPEGVFLSPADRVAGETTAGYYPGVDPVPLARVEDDTFFQAADHEAWFQMLSVLAKKDPAEFDRQAASVGYVELDQQPEAYRGRPVRLHGAARRAVEIKAPDNPHGIEKYYQIVLRPAGGPDWPLFVYCLTLPDGFATGESISAEISASGLFFKNLAYRTAAEPGQGPAVLTAPTILAQTIRWSPATVAAAEPRSEPSPWAMVAVGIASAMIGLFGAAMLSRRANASSSTASVRGKANVDESRVADALARLSNEASTTASDSAYDFDSDSDSDSDSGGAYRSVEDNPGDG
jgi:hypothetical protein